MPFGILKPWLIKLIGHIIVKFRVAFTLNKKKGVNMKAKIDVKVKSGKPNERQGGKLKCNLQINGRATKH